MNISDNSNFSFNGQDYDCVVRLYNGVNDVYLNNVAWDSLIIEEDIFDWKIKGSIIINSPYESLEKDSVETILSVKTKKENLIYKFRNDGRDTLFISIKPKSVNMKGLPVNLGLPYNFNDKQWLLEIEAVIFDVEDLPSTNITDKKKKLFFWEKAYQMMTEKDSDFSTSTVGKNSNKTNISQVDNNERSLICSEAIAELLRKDPDFQKYSKLTNNKEEWDSGSELNTMNYSSPVNAKFIDNLDYMLRYTTASDVYNNEPCIFKFERAEKSMTPKQFSLKPISKYFEKAGKEQNTPKEYQIEHFFLKENSDSEKTPPLLKSPLGSAESKEEFKADEYNTIYNYRLVDLSGKDYSKNLTNYRVVSYNSSDGQFCEENKNHNAQQYKDYFKKYIRNNIITKENDDRLVFTPFIKDTLNTRTIFTIAKEDITRLTEGRNKLLNYYLFSNLAINFTTRGLTLRQTGRFFGLSKQNLNNKEYDHKIEGQYFITSVIHLFNNRTRNYSTEIIGVKTHTYQEITKFESDDVFIIK
jgi:hypothetical protein